MKHFAVLATVLAATLIAPLASAADAGSAHVYLQRTTDGRVILTDRPLDGARTERSWQVEREDPAAARARGERVHIEAEAVAERIARRLELQDMMAERREREDLAQRTSAVDGPALDGAALIYPGSYGRQRDFNRLHGRMQRPVRGPLLQAPVVRGPAPRPFITAPF